MGKSDSIVRVRRRRAAVAGISGPLLIRTAAMLLLLLQLFIGAPPIPASGALLDSATNTAEGRAWRGNAHDDQYASHDVKDRFVKQELSSRYLDSIGRSLLAFGAVNSGTGCRDDPSVPCAAWKQMAYCPATVFFDGVPRAVKDYWCPLTCGACGLPDRASILLAGQSLMSPTGRFRLDMLPANGDVILYRVSDRKLFWSLGSSGDVDYWPPAVPGPYMLFIREPDGNVVLSGAGGAVVWATRLGSVGSGPRIARLTDYGIVELVAADGRVYWSSECPHVPPGYTFLPSKNSSGADLARNTGDGSYAAAAACDVDCRCRGFNTDGWLKGGINVVKAVYDDCVCCGLYVRDNPAACPPAPSPPQPTSKRNPPPSPPPPPPPPPRRSPPPPPRRTPPPPRPPPPPPASWPQDVPLGEGHALISPLRRHRLMMRLDGDLVIYRLSDGVPTWDLGVWGSWPTAVPGPYRLMLRASTGNLAVEGAGGAALVWDTRLASLEPGPYGVRLTDDGNLELIYSSTGAVYWSSACPIIPAGYGFVPLKMYDGDDIGFKEGGIGNAALACSSDCRCRGFNSDGGLKAFIDFGAAYGCGDTCCGIYMRQVDPPSCSSPPSPPSPPPMRPTPPRPPLPPPRPPPSSRSSPLPPTPAVLWSQGKALKQGSSLISPSGVYSLDMQSNGNLVIHSSADGTAVWDLPLYSGLIIPPPFVAGPYKMLLNGTDGNLQVTGPGGAIVWTTRLAFVDPGPFMLRFTNEGVTELVAGNGVTYWSSACPNVPLGYRFMPLKDHAGDELALTASGGSPNDAALACDRDCQCTGFNSYGSLKRRTNINRVLKCSCCGLYVRDNNPPTC